MKVSGPGQVANVSRAKGTGKAGGDGGFSKMLDSVGEEKEIHGASGISKISAVNYINSVDDDEQSKRRRLVTNAEDLLDELGKIRDALLSGNLSSAGLLVIQNKIGQIEANCNDPKLNAIIDEIKTRAAVELAKLGQF